MKLTIGTDPVTDVGVVHLEMSREEVEDLDIPKAFRTIVAKAYHSDSSISERLFAFSILAQLIEQNQSQG